eukprot:scaffold15070_cov38-Phaeocystis_antarctica.AAC.1
MASPKLTSAGSPDGGALLSLQSWLRKASPRGACGCVEPTHVLIPCVSGEKRPAFEYKDDLWSWDKFDEVMRERGAQELVQERGTKGAPQLVQVDWAIVLRDLCVIDCDSPEVSCPTRNPTQTPTPNPTLNPSSS